MDLQRTIDGLEAQAAQYTEAANTLRALVEKTATQPAATKGRPGRKPAEQPVAAKAAKKGRRAKRGPVSEETRAKIAAAIKARHAEKKAAAQAIEEEQAQSQPQDA